MKHLFKGPLDNLEYMCQSDLDLPHTLSLDSLSEDELSKIAKGYIISTDGIILTLTDTDLVEDAIKKQECQDTILAEFSRSDQANITGDAQISGDNTQLIVMRNYIKAMVNEYQTNGANADYSAITPV